MLATFSPVGLQQLDTLCVCGAATAAVDELRATLGATFAASSEDAGGGGGGGGGGGASQPCGPASFSELLAEAAAAAMAAAAASPQFGAAAPPPGAPPLVSGLAAEQRLVDSDRIAAGMAKYAVRGLYYPLIAPSLNFGSTISHNLYASQDWAAAEAAARGALAGGRAVTAPLSTGAGARRSGW